MVAVRFAGAPGPWRRPPQPGRSPAGRGPAAAPRRRRGPGDRPGPGKPRGNPGDNPGDTQGKPEKIHGKTGKLREKLRNIGKEGV